MNAKQLIKLSIIPIIFICLGCNQAKQMKEQVLVTETDINDTFESVKNEQKNADTKDITHAIPNNLKIIKSANVKYKVKDVRSTTNQIQKLAYNYKAYISDLRFENTLYQKQNRFTIKVPNENFDITVDSMRAFVEFVDYENITTKDVTEEYVDIETRLRTKIEVKERYESILRKNAVTIEDILKVEEKLRIIQEEIEASKGRLKYLTHKTAYSTINIELYETVNYTEKPISYSKTFWEKSKEGFSFGWDFIETVCIGIFYVWPFLIIGIIIFLILKSRNKKK